MHHKAIVLFIAFLISVSSQAQTEGEKALRSVWTGYNAIKTLSFDGNIKYYTSINNSNPSEVMMISYRRDGKKMHITIGDQIIIYDGKINIVVNEGEKNIYVSAAKMEKAEKITPSEALEEYLEEGLFDVRAEDYRGSKRKITIKSTEEGVGSYFEFLYQPTTNFIEFARMIVDREEDEGISPDFNKKKFEYSYYNYKTTLSEKISTEGYVMKVKSGKNYTFKGVGKYKDFQIIMV